jgi:hypothetical protein
MINILDVLKEVPLTEVLRERLELEQSKSEFEIRQLNAKLEDAESQRNDFKARFETEQQNHTLTRKELDEARAMIQKFTQTPRPPPTVNVGIPKLRGVF